MRDSIERDNPEESKDQNSDLAGLRKLFTNTSLMHAISMLHQRTSTKMLPFNQTNFILRKNTMRSSRNMIAVLAVMLSLLEAAWSDCGCLKCSKGLTVISPPSSPLKIILRGKVPSKLKAQNYVNYVNPYDLAPRLPVYPPAAPTSLYGAQVQIPYIPPPPTPLITSLAPAPDRIVLPAPEVAPPAAYPFTSSGPFMETVAIPPPCDDRPTMSVQEVPFYSQYAYPPPQPAAPSQCPCQGYASDLLVDYVLSLRPLESKVRTKRGVLPYRPPFHHHHHHHSLLRSPFHFFLRTIPKLLAFPIVQFFRMLTGFPPRPPLRSTGPYERDLLQSRRYVPEVASRSELFHSRRYRPTPRSVLLSKLKKINELTRDVSDYRRKRSLAFHTDEESVPFYRITEVDEEGGGEDEDDEDAETVGREFLKPFHFKQIIPHNPLFYLLNTPIRILTHLDKLKNQIRPVVSTIPLVLQNSKKYLLDFGKQFHSHVLDFASNLIGDFDHAPHFRPLRPLVPRKLRYRRSAFAQLLKTTTTTANKTEDGSFERTYSLAHPFNLERGNRSKRFVLKMVDEKEVEEFLKEKLGEDAPVVAKKKESIGGISRRPKKLVVEPLAPKIIFDRKGKTFVELNGMKRPFFSKRKNKQQPHTRDETDDINSKIAELIEQARSSAPLVGASYDSSMYHQIVREKITQTLKDIDDLINVDFTKYINLYEDLRKLQNVKAATVDNWKELLVTNRINDMEGKIHILNALKQMQSTRAAILKKVVAMLDGRPFMASKLVKMLVRLQKLQCVVYSVVEEFGERLQTKTSFDPQREIRYVDHLEGINFVAAKTREEVEDYLRNERDGELERRIRLLERLRELLEVEDSSKINEEARLLWEMRNIEKMQQESIKELNVKIERGQKVRKELKILFDLERQLEAAEKKQEEILKEKQEVVGRSKQKQKRPLGAKMATA